MEVLRSVSGSVNAVFMYSASEVENYRAANDKNRLLLVCRGRVT